MLIVEELNDALSHPWQQSMPTAIASLQQHLGTTQKNSTSAPLRNARELLASTHVSCLPKLQGADPGLIQSSDTSRFRLSSRHRQQCRDVMHHRLQALAD